MENKVKENEYEKPAYSYPILLVVTILLIMFSSVDRSETVKNSEKDTPNNSITSNESIEYDTTSVYFVNAENK
jgi:hypothetical protein